MSWPTRDTDKERKDKKVNLLFPLFFPPTLVPDTLEYANECSIFQEHYVYRCRRLLSLILSIRVYILSLDRQGWMCDNYDYDDDDDDNNNDNDNDNDQGDGADRHCTFPHPGLATLATLPSDFHILCRDPFDDRDSVGGRSLPSGGQLASH